MKERLSRIEQSRRNEKLEDIKEEGNNTPIKQQPSPSKNLLTLNSLSCGNDEFID